MSNKIKQTVSICFIGHVDAGKSTLNGRILLDLALVDSRTIEKYQKESALINRESWYLSWLTDTSPTERQKGKTQEMCSTILSLPNINININDTPGHKLYLQDMIRGSNQSDVALLVVSARRGEFEAGFVRSGQTREHVILSKAGGVKFLIVVINKMDEADYSKESFFNIVTKLNKFLDKIYKNIVYVPISGYHGDNLLHEEERDTFQQAATATYTLSHKNESFKIEDLIKNISFNRCNITNENFDEQSKSNFHGKGKMPWYNGDSLLKILNSLKIERNYQDNMATVLEQNKNIAVVKVESGIIENKWDYIILPSKKTGKVLSVLDDEEVEIERAYAGEIVRLKVSDENFELGEVFLDQNVKKHDISSIFTCNLTIINTKNVITPGYKCLMHLRMATKIVKIVALQKVLNNQKVIKIQYCGAGEKVRAKMSVVDGPVFVRTGDCFAIRDEDITVGVGSVRKILNGYE